MLHTIDNWQFHPDYFDPTLPQSIQNNIKKSLNESKIMPIEDITQLHPVIENKINRASINYMKKMEASSARYRKKKSNMKTITNNGQGKQRGYGDTPQAEEDNFDPYDQLNELLKGIKKI